MSSDPTRYAATEPKTIGGWWAKNRATLRPLLGALAAALVGSVLTYLGVNPKVVEVITTVPAPMGAEPPPLVDYEGLPFHGTAEGDGHGACCGRPEPIRAQPARWPTDRITYGIDYASAARLNPRISDAAVKAAIRQAAGWWSEHLAIELVEVPLGTGPAIPITFERIDGPAGVLAEAYLADGSNRPKPLRFDSSEHWTAGPPAPNEVSLPTVACHELGHSLGLGHDAPNAPAVMRPSYTASIPRETERDVMRMVGLGYKRREKVPPAPTDLITFPISAKTDDVADALRKAGFTVTRP
jgi:hypothetical protein